MLRPGWFRQNRLALLIVIVLLPATLAIMFANQWLGFFENYPSKPVEVSAGESVRYGDSGWQIESTDRFSADSVAGLERNLPTGTDLVVVRVRVDPTGASTDTGADTDTGAATNTNTDADTNTDFLTDDIAGLCTVRLDEAGGANLNRSWTNAVGGPVPLGGTGPALTSCSGEQTTSYTFDAQFVVPADTGDWSRLTLGISVVGELPRYARFALD